MASQQFPRQRCVCNQHLKMYSAQQHHHCLSIARGSAFVMLRETEYTDGSRCLFSHDVTASKPSTICKFYQRGQCAYGSRCRYDHVKPPTGKAAAEHTGRNVEAIAAPQTMYSDTSALGITAELGRPDKKPLVLRDRALCSLSDERIPSYSDGLCWSSEEESLNSRPLSYLEAIQAGLENSASSSNLSDTPQLCPYAAAGQCYSRESCGYVHGEVCDICGLEVLHPADPEQRREHEKVGGEPPGHHFCVCRWCIL
ncbi:MKRN2 ligase, partial [Polypterus senegalus]